VYQKTMTGRQSCERKESLLSHYLCNSQSRAISCRNISPAAVLLRVELVGASYAESNGGIRGSCNVQRDVQRSVGTNFGCVIERCSACRATVDARSERARDVEHAHERYTHGWR